MAETGRIIDFAPHIAAARAYPARQETHANVARHGAHTVTLPLSALWRIMQEAPLMALRDDGVAAAAKAR